MIAGTWASFACYMIKFWDLKKNWKEAKIFNESEKIRYFTCPDWLNSHPWYFEPNILN
jgi:hypothetical protein